MCKDSAATAAPPVRTIHLDHPILDKNARLAERNRGWLEARRIVAFNLLSSPGSGKTTLLERTIRDLGRELSIHVIEGDQATDNDARRIEAAGAPAVQINTGAGCHLDASMVSKALQTLDPKPGSVVFVENVGNLVCPAMFDLGEAEKVLVCSVTEGEDKPLKYPHMFRACTVLLLNKIDLLPYVAFEVDRFIDNALLVNPALEVFLVSASRGDGLGGWYDRIRRLAVPDSASRWGEVESSRESPP
ncbi:hydrogenase nickel incorporation protein HypB [Paludisphaera mucosa]|uniref:Hydrogenase nickel incorporation protein HypB n=1 Tax=Paludisphaera mucosa TaxID=3030827 RepID=A0ABT6FD01_9BACT|nr:hydrogenase nickel incorporation protein HypB [Paludisphaera mucosa]MDG3005451.1 hydrogenase nickel incorporation protein HypB [Paludisphaera mucosa]